MWRRFYRRHYIKTWKRRGKHGMKNNINENHMKNYARRIKWFVGISAVYFLYTIGSMVLFIATDLKWEDDFLRIGYFTYLAAFTGYNWFRFHQSSVAEEQGRNKEFVEFCKEHEIPLFDHKESRRNVGRISFLCIALNVLLITFEICNPSF